jgi:mRNA interferase RelE/StbE
MKHAIILAPQAAEDLKRLGARDRAATRDALETHLRHQPTRISKSRIKRLRGLDKLQFRLRVGEIRVFYDVRGGAVEILAIIPRSEATQWLQRHGTRR